MSAQPSSRDRSDVMIGVNRRVWINGTVIGNVQDFNFAVDQSGQRVTLEFIADSLVFGEMPPDVVEAITGDQRDPDDTVDIHRAIARAQARKHGLDPLTTVTQAAFDRPQKPDQDQPESVCSHYSEGEGFCSKPRGHGGPHRYA